MAITQNTYTGNGSTVLFSFTFPYLETTDIKVTLDGTLTTAYTLANATTIQFNTAPTAGSSIRIYRDTDDANLSATFYPGSAIRSQDLNDNFTQNLYVTQEVNNNAVSIDGSNTMVGDFDMGGYKITNLAAPVVGTDAANRTFVEGVFSSEVPVFYRRWSKTAVGGETSLSGTDDNGISLSYVAGSEKVFINGALQVRGIDYSGTTGTTLTGIPALIAGDIVEVHSSSSYTVGTVPDGSVTNAKVDGGAAIQSTKLAFTQSGTGATTRTVESKLRDVVSVKDFGAVGDGVTDDTAAIQAALNNGRSVFFPRGQYNISSTLHVSNNARLIGELPQSNNQPLSSSQVLIYGTVENIGDGNALLQLHDGTYTANQSVQNRLTSIVIENISFESNKVVDYSNLSATTSSGVIGVDVSSVKDGLEFIQCSFKRLAYGIKQVTLEPYLDKLTLSRCHFTLLYKAIQAGPTAGLSLDNTWIYDCFTWVDATPRSDSYPVPSPSTLHSNRGSEVFLNASTLQNSSSSTNYACVSALSITAIGCWFEGGNNWLNPSKFAFAQSCYFSEAIPVTGSRFSVSPAGNNCSIMIQGCRIGTSTRLINFENVTDKTTVSITCIGNYNGADFAEPAAISTHLAAGLDYEGYGNANNSTWNASQHNRNVGIGKAGNAANSRVHILKNTSGAGVYLQITDSSSSGGKAGIIFERTQTNAGDFKIEDALGQLVFSSANDASTWVERAKLTDTWAWTPGADNTQSLGTSALKWSVVYAGTGTINTSDAREKQQDRPLLDAEKAVAIKAKDLLKAFKYNDAVAIKGDKARIHFGVYAQELIDVFASEGLNAEDYGLFCYDEWEAKFDDDGNEISPAGNRYGIRYEELLAFIIAAL